jgi:hypothetical protein
MESFEEQLERLSKDFVWLEDYEVSNLPDEERWSYINKRKLIWDTNAMCRIIETARKDAGEKARKEEQEIAKKQTYQNIKETLKSDLTIQQIAKLFKVNEEEVLKIKNRE